jgi:hypothetical protein
MQTKVRGRLTPANAAGFSEYMRDLLRPSHVGKLIESRYFGCANENELRLAIAGVAYAERKIRRGPKLKNSAVELEAGSPYGVGFTPDERRLIENTVITKLDIVTCLFSWHISRPEDKAWWREDFHVLAANEDSLGRPLTARQRGNLRRHFKSVMDRMHDLINKMRRKNKADHIPTMREVRDRQRSEGRALLLPLLAESEIELTPINIVEWLRSQCLLGKRYPKDDDYEASVSILYPPARRARREPLKALIADVLALRRQLQPKPSKKLDRKAEVQKAKQTLFGPTQHNVKSR